MNAVPFDTLKLADRLSAGGFTPEQARAASSALAEAVGGADLVTKDHFDARLKLVDGQFSVIDERFKVVDERFTRVEERINATERRLEERIVASENRITLRLGSMLVIGVGLLLAAIRYLPRA
ncbi:MAG: hypothetical protein ACOVQ8_00285 [Elstera sp.]|jgi:hypothetical protein